MLRNEEHEGVRVLEEQPVFPYKDGAGPEQRDNARFINLTRPFQRFLRRITEDDLSLSFQGGALKPSPTRLRDVAGSRPETEVSNRLNIWASKGPNDVRLGLRQAAFIQVLR
ncbi:MAG: hypothetical protein BWY68_00466 [bacterium ADurb.Bin400]|nr:MAG: hypothetical protein BWY68_00466 [bacterium ADurb.Bin400]